jgi:hypothetical protein
VVTLTAPVVAPGITIATKLVPVLLIAIAATPPIVIAVGLLKLVPVIVTKVPTEPLAGANEVIVGCAKTGVNPVNKNRNTICFRKYFVILLIYIQEFMEIK